MYGKEHLVSYGLWGANNAKKEEAQETPLLPQDLPLVSFSNTKVSLKDAYCLPLDDSHVPETAVFAEDEAAYDIDRLLHKYQALPNEVRDELRRLKDKYVNWGQK